jgi:UDP-glucose 4-epimerase
LKNLNGGRGCLVTGVAGFVGSHLAERLLSEGCAVVGVDNFFSGHRENLAFLIKHPDFFFHECSITETGLLRDLKTRYPDLAWVFHLAAIVSVPYSMDHPETVMEVNHQSTVNLLREAEQLGLKAFVFAGSSAEYGEEQRLPLREEYARDSTRHLSPYGHSKYLASREVSRSSAGVALRCFNIYGPRQDPGSPYSGVISRFISMSLARKPLTIFGDGQQTRDFIYVRDVVEAYLRAVRICMHAERAGQRLYNIGTGASTTILDLAEAVNELAGNEGNLSFCAERPGDIRFSVAATEAFGEVSGWRARVPLREGLGETIAWAKDFHQVFRTLTPRS